MDIENELKKLILSRYRSILDFSKSINMPYSTIDSIFKRGVQNANITNIIKICAELNISADELANEKIVPNTSNSNKPNQVIAIARGGEKVQYDLTESEMQAILTLLDSMKKDK